MGRRTEHVITTFPSIELFTPGNTMLSLHLPIAKFFASDILVEISRAEALSQLFKPYHITGMSRVLGCNYSSVRIYNSIMWVPPNIMTLDIIAKQRVQVPPPEIRVKH